MLEEGFKTIWLGGCQQLKQVKQRFEDDPMLAKLNAMCLSSDAFSKTASRVSDLLTELNRPYEVLGEAAPVDRTDDLFMVLLSRITPDSLPVVEIVRYLAEHEGTNINSDIRNAARKYLMYLTYKNQQNIPAAKLEQLKQQFETWSFSCIT